MKNYEVTVTSNGEDCLKVYNEELHKITFDTTSNQSCYCSLSNNPPFDIGTFRLPYAVHKWSRCS